MTDLEDGKWRGIAERLVGEVNTDKLYALVDELCLAMDQRLKSPDVEASFRSNHSRTFEFWPGALAEYLGSQAP